MVSHTIALESCDGVLTSEFLTFPRGSFTYHIAGVDSHGTAFKYNTKVEASFPGCSFTPYFTLDTSGTSDVVLKRRQLLTIRFQLSGNTSEPYHFTLSSPPTTWLRTSISPSSVIVSGGQTVEIAMSVTLSSSRASAGIRRTVTLVASSGDTVAMATRRIIIKETDVSCYFLYIRWICTITIIPNTGNNHSMRLQE